MEKEIDSVTKSIVQGDTTRKNGYLIGCAYYITKNKKTKINSTIVYIDSISVMRYTEFMDSACIGSKSFYWLRFYGFSWFQKKDSTRIKSFITYFMFVILKKLYLKTI